MFASAPAHEASDLIAAHHRWPQSVWLRWKEGVALAPLAALERGFVHRRLMAWSIRALMASRRGAVQLGVSGWVSARAIGAMERPQPLKHRFFRSTPRTWKRALAFRRTRKPFRRARSCSPAT